MGLGGECVCAINLIQKTELLVGEVPAERLNYSFLIPRFYQSPYHLSLLPSY